MNHSHTLGVLATTLLFVGCAPGAGIDGPFEVTRYIHEDIDSPPNVNAGPDQTVTSGDIVTLNGNAHDDYWVRRVEWRQQSGPTVSLGGAVALRPTFVAPPVSETTELKFLLRAHDNKGQVGSDSTSVFVRPLGGPPIEPPPGTYALNFDSLPSAQGWVFMRGGLAEGDAFSVDGASLAQRTIGTGNNSSARYQKDDVADPSKRMVLSVTARVLSYEKLSEGSVGLGFNFYISNGVHSHRLALTDTLVQVGGQFYGLNTTDIHDYRLELNPGGNFELYVDGVIFATGVGSETALSNRIFFGDSTAHENADAEILAFSFAVGTD